jgi:hypothetical protein
MKLRVLITLKPDAMTRARDTSQKGRSGSTVKVVNNVVVSSSNFARDPGASQQSSSFKHNDVVDVWMAVQQWCNPVFNQHVNLNVWQKSLQSES